MSDIYTDTLVKFIEMPVAFLARSTNDVHRDVNIILIDIVVIVYRQKFVTYIG